MAGWGKANQDRSDLGSFEEFGVFERTAMIAELGVIDRDECRQKVGQNVHAERQFCAGGELGERNPNLAAGRTGYINYISYRCRLL